jgi:hypothetical protein
MVNESRVVVGNSTLVPDDRRLPVAIAVVSLDDRPWEEDETGVLRRPLRPLLPAFPSVGVVDDVDDSVQVVVVDVDNVDEDEIAVGGMCLEEVAEGAEEEEEARE